MRSPGQPAMRDGRRPRSAGALGEIGMALGGSLLVGGALLAAVTGPAPSPALLPVFCWALAGAGVTGTFLAGRGISWGWLILVGLQPLWITYAVATAQYGFIFAALAYGGAQVNGFLRSRAGGGPFR